MVDLWLMQSQKYIDIALEEGFRKFTWHLGPLVHSRYELFSWVRAHSAAYGPVKVMIIGHNGAAEYNTFVGYDKPTAVYPTWAADEDLEDLEFLMQTNVADDEDICNSPEVHVQMRPVTGQKHRVVIHRIPPAGLERQMFMLQMREIQLRYPQAEMFISGCMRFNDLFGLGFKAVDYLPIELTAAGYSQDRVHLPTGKVIARESVNDPRYADWFDLIGMPQYDVTTGNDRIRFSLRSARWASKNFEHVKPFVTKNTSGGGPNTIFMDSAWRTTSDRLFVLPAARRRVMRNLGIKLDEYDKFTCDTCILHNACTLYREGSVCTVKGSEAVALADAFGSRSADVIMTGLSNLLQRNAERLEDALAAEKNDDEGGLDPEVTKLSKTVFDQGVKLVKLIDPSKAGGAKVQVNVGVGAGGTANVGIEGSDPKQMMATIVADLEASGIPRSQIDGAMIKGVLRNMAQTDQRQAVSTAVTKHQKNAPKEIEGEVS